MPTEPPPTTANPGHPDSAVAEWAELMTSTQPGHRTTATTSSPAHRSQRRVLMTTCQTHGAVGFTNLLVTKEGGVIVLNPHIGNCCVLRLDEHIATALHHLLGEWLGL